MKNFLFALSVATATLTAFSGCKKEYITNVLPGVSYTTNVVTSEWRETAAGSGVYVVDLDFPELDANYFRHGSVQVAIRFDHAYNIVPATIDNTHYSVGYVVGTVTLYAEDRYADPLPPVPMTVKITLTDAENGGG